MIGESIYDWLKLGCARQKYFFDVTMGLDN